MRLALRAGWCLLALVVTSADTASACSTYAQAYRAALKSDLRRLVDAEAAHFRATGGYTSDLQVLATKTGYRLSPSVTLVFARADASGWRAEAHHAKWEGVCTGSVASGSADARLVADCLPTDIGCSDSAVPVIALLLGALAAGTVVWLWVRRRRPSAL